MPSVVLRLQAKCRVDLLVGILRENEGSVNFKWISTNRCFSVQDNVMVRSESLWCLRLNPSATNSELRDLEQVIYCLSLSLA